MSLVKIFIVLLLVIATAVLFLLFTGKGNEILVDLLPRPQTPRNRPYIIQQVSYPGGTDGVMLAGELTMPREGGPFPAVILITGSGPQDRDETIMGHKIFLVLSDYLTRRGFAVLRHDDRGVGQSTGTFNDATTKDFADDAAASMRWLQKQENIDTSQIGYAGHSEGGYIAPLAALEEKPAFMVLLMGPAQSYAATGIEQQIAFAKAAGKSDVDIKKIRTAITNIVEQARQSENVEQMRKRIKPIIDENADIFPEWFVEAGLDIVGSKWGLWLLNHDPLPPLKAFDGPILAIYGGKDTHVSAKTNVPIMKNMLTHKASRTITFPNLNHMFQPAKTGAIDEYVWSDTTFDEKTMKIIANWLVEVKKSL